MKQHFKLVTTAVILMVIILTGFFAWQIIRGIKPIVVNTSKDIGEIIDDINNKNIINSGQIATSTNTTDMPLNLPGGFSISMFARDLGPARVITNLPGGGLLVSVTKAGQIVALPDRDGDGRADEKIVVLSRLYNPHGLIVRCDSESQCQLYIAETNAVSVYDYSQSEYTATNRRELFKLPDDGGHHTRTLLWAVINGEDKLLTSVGSSCNVCDEKDEERASILISDFDGGNLEVYASGLRNSVFMATQPVTGEVWATDMGRDWLGDDLPPDEINIIREGGDYGWPICYGNNIHDTEFDKNQYIRNPCEDKEPAKIELQAHSAPLGIDFIPEEGWPEEYWYNAIVAYHGSWNRSKPTGYKVVRMKLDANGNYLGREDFITGWLTENGEALGRPVALMIQPGGIMYLSDDKADVIYRIIYTGERSESSDTGVRSDMISLDKPLSNTLIRSPLVLTGQARGTWYFEASFPVELRDADGGLIATHYAEAQSDGSTSSPQGWMTEDFVPFKLELTFDPPMTETGELILKKDNPSGLPENDDAISLPVRFAEISLGEACENNEDCLLPGDYAIRSSCPYEARCINSTCTVVCPDF